MPEFGITRSETDLYLAKVTKRVEALRGRIAAERVPVEDIAWRRTPDREVPARAMRARYRRCRLPLEWGQQPETAWFRLRFRVPRAWRGRRVELVVHPDGEGVIFMNGAPVQGLDPNRDEFLLAGRARGGERFELFIEAGSLTAFGKHGSRCFDRCELIAVDEAVRDAWFDLEALVQLASCLPAGEARRGRAIAALNDAVNSCPLGDSEAELSAWARAARRELRPVLAARNGTDAVELSLNGHAHIDVAWLWPLAETVRKCSRTFSTALKYMEQYPDFVFTQSQPQLYAWARDHYPELYRRIRRRVREGRWEAAAGMWVESDCNLAGGEGLVRQILHGKRFMREELGVDTRVCWLPDVFGFPASLPQILAKGGLPYFFTIKIDWNETNRMPFPSFWWKGIDGSRVLAHFGANRASYNGKVRAADLRRAAEFLLERDARSERGLFPFGFGDGGGGPTREMLEFAARSRDLQGLPRTRQERADSFFRRLEREAGRLPEWTGELYLELHRGTSTTQARTKRDNRRAELALREAEILSCLQLAAGGSYPREELDRAWKTVLLNHFHDVLPGSSISQVYSENAEQYAGVFAAASRASAGGLRSLGRRMDTSGPGKSLLVFNSLSWARGGIVELDDPGSPAAVRSESGAELPVQRAGGKLLVAAREVPSMGAAVWHLEGRSPRRTATPLKVSTSLLENDLVRVRFDRRGLISSLVDKRAGRELLPRGKRGNVLQLFEDRPRAWDAWDVDFSFAESGRDITALRGARVLERGPVRAAVRFERRFGKSRLVQEVRLAAGSAVVEFFTRVDWREDAKLLKAAFPVDVNAERATYEIQFGSVERSTERSTSWERARFEVPAHRWADLSEPGFGASLLNDCKYGYDCTGGVLRLSLLRSPSTPDPAADRGEHEFTYAIYPHAGDWREALSVRAGLELNVPLRAVPAPRGSGELGPSCSLISVDAANVVVEAVKAAEGSDDVVLRIYEAHGSRAAARLRTLLPASSARETDLLEKGGRRLRLRRQGAGAELRLEFRPFEIKTVVLRLNLRRKPRRNG
ncbi:MAG: alpha-mannosidase [Planctomycetota bacterium]|jgi:alpha-mannosidase